MSEILNIAYYNLCKASYMYYRLFFAYLNPFCWMSHYSKRHLPWAIYKQHLAKNIPDFKRFNSSRRLALLAYSKAVFLSFFIYFALFAMIIDGKTSEHVFLTALFIDVLISILAYIHVFKNDKFKAKQAEYERLKINYHPYLFHLWPLSVVLSLLVLSQFAG